MKSASWSGLGPTLCGLCSAVAAGCGKPPAIDRQKAVGVFVEVPVATGPGLSGLAADASGSYWTVAEREAAVYRITLDDALVPKVETLPVHGVPAGTDLEGIAVLAEGAGGVTRFALGTEGQLAGRAAVLVAERTSDGLTVSSTIGLPESVVGIPLQGNQGAEGVCGAGEVIFAAIEGAGAGAGERAGKRWAPVVRIVAGKPERTYRVWLTSDVGKLSGLDCRIGADGTASVMAIERHFAVTKVLRFSLAAQADITPEVALDLGPILRSGLNLEGIAWLDAGPHAGQVAAAVDNQWRTITGPSELLVFEPGALRAPGLPPVAAPAP